jgi:hypothetical protein
MKKNTVSAGFDKFGQPVTMRTSQIKLQITSANLQLNSKSQVSNSKHSESWSFEFGNYLKFVICHLNFSSSVPDIEKCQSNDDRERRNRNEEHDFKNAFFVFEVHEKPEHEARLGRSDQKIGEHAERAEVQLRGLDRCRRECEKSEPCSDVGLRADDMCLTFFHGDTYYLSVYDRSTMPASFRRQEHPPVHVHAEYPHSLDEDGHPAIRAPGKKSIEPIHERACHEKQKEEQVPCLEAPDADPDQEE